MQMYFCAASGRQNHVTTCIKHDISKNKTTNVPPLKWIDIFSLRLDHETMLGVYVLICSYLFQINNIAFYQSWSIQMTFANKRCGFRVCKWVEIVENSHAVTIKWVLQYVCYHHAKCVSNITLQFIPHHTLKTKSCHDANFIVTCGTVGCLYDNLRCHQCRLKLASSQFSMQPPKLDKRSINCPCM